MKIVRRAEERDIPALLELLVQVDMVHHGGRPDLFKGPATKYTAEELRELLREEDRPVFVCAEGDRILGHGFCVLQHFGGNVMTERKTLYIDDICVDENVRGSGAGRLLFEYIRAFAEREGCYNITLNVWTCNPGAMAFYEKMGMTPYKTAMETVLRKAEDAGTGK